MNNELAKAQCEADSAWEAYCRTPSDGTWALYVEAKKREDKLSSEVDGSEPDQRSEEEVSA